MALILNNNIIAHSHKYKPVSLPIIAKFSNPGVIDFIIVFLFAFIVGLSGLTQWEQKVRTKKQEGRNFAL